jgi:hypothetical protein
MDHRSLVVTLRVEVVPLAPCRTHAALPIAAVPSAAWSCLEVEDEGRWPRGPVPSCKRLWRTAARRAHGRGEALKRGGGGGGPVGWHRRARGYGGRQTGALKVGGEAKKGRVPKGWRGHPPGGGSRRRGELRR